MDVYIGNPGSGKTYEMIKRASETGDIIIVPNEVTKKGILDAAKSMKMDIEIPITYNELIYSTTYFPVIKENKRVIIDNVEDFISYMINIFVVPKNQTNRVSQVSAITLSTPIKDLKPISRKDPEKTLEKIIEEKEEEERILDSIHDIIKIDYDNFLKSDHLALDDPEEFLKGIAFN